MSFYSRPYIQVWKRILLGLPPELIDENVSDRQVGGKDLRVTSVCPQTLFSPTSPLSSLPAFPFFLVLPPLWREETRVRMSTEGPRKCQDLFNEEDERPSSSNLPPSLFTPNLKGRITSMPPLSRAQIRTRPCSLQAANSARDHS